MKIRHFPVILGLFFAAAVAPVFALSDAPEPPKKMASPVNDTARLDYNLGYEIFDKARKAEADATTLTGAKKTKAMAAVLDQYKAARVKFEAAAAGDPKMSQAFNHIGYTARRLGDYNASLDAYDRALELNPKYLEAIEYRAEAYLALNRIDDAKGAYMTLFGESRPIADTLMQSMQAWVVARRKAAAGVAPDQLETFARWLEERSSIAKQTASLGFGAPMASGAQSWN